ncbi:MAG: hypothetical protein QW620_00910 [Thermoplasmata archaeon]
MARGKKRRKKGPVEQTDKTTHKYEFGEQAVQSRQLECYVFNDSLDAILDDGTCEHCRYFLTTRCPHVDEFLEEVEDMEPDL